MTLEERIRKAEADLFHTVGAEVDESFLDLANTGLRVRLLAAAAARRWFCSTACRSAPPRGRRYSPRSRLAAARHRPSRSRALGPRLISTWSCPRAHAPADRGHLRRARARPSAVRRPLAGRNARALVCGGRHRADLKAGRDRRARGRAPRRPRTDAAVAADGPRPRVAVLRSPSPRPVYRRLLAQGLGSAEVAAAPDSLIDALRLSARRPGNARTVTSLMHAIDHFRRPRAESVLTSPELAAISTPTMFIWGTNAPYLSANRARPSIDQIPSAHFTKCPADTAPGSSTPNAARS